MPDGASAAALCITFCLEGVGGRQGDGCTVGKNDLEDGAAGAGTGLRIHAESPAASDAA